MNPLCLSKVCSVTVFSNVLNSSNMFQLTSPMILSLIPPSLVHCLEPQPIDVVSLEEMAADCAGRMEGLNFIELFRWCEYLHSGWFVQNVTYMKINNVGEGRIFTKGAYFNISIFNISISRSFEQNKGQAGSRYTYIHA